MPTQLSNNEILKRLETRMTIIHQMMKDKNSDSINLILISRLDAFQQVYTMITGHEYEL